MPKQIKCFQALLTLTEFQSAPVNCCCSGHLFSFSFLTGIRCYVFAEAFGAFTKDCDHIL